MGRCLIFLFILSGEDVGDEANCAPQYTFTFGICGLFGRILPVLLTFTVLAGADEHVMPALLAFTVLAALRIPRLRRRRCGISGELDEVRVRGPLHVVQDLPNDKLLQLGDKDLLELARVDVAEEVISADFTRLTLEKDLDDLGGRDALRDHVPCLILLEG